MRTLTSGHFTLHGALSSLGPGRLFKSGHFWLAVTIASGGTFAYTWFVPRVADHRAVAGDFLVIAGSLLGVVIAGFAIVAALVDEKYAGIMRRARVHPYDVLRHFLVEGGLLVASVSSTVIYRAIAVTVHRGNPTVEFSLFGATALLFFWGLFGVLQLMRLVLSIAVTSMVSVRDGGDTGAESDRQVS